MLKWLSFKCFSFKLWTNFTPSYSVSDIDFDMQVSALWWHCWSLRFEVVLNFNQN